MRNLARWCVEHRRTTVLGWIAALVGLTALSLGVGSSYSDSFTLSGTESLDAQNLLKRAAPKAAGDREQVVIAVKSGTVRDPAVRSEVNAMLARLAKLHTVASVESPYGPAGAAQVSPDGRVAFANVTMSREAPEIKKAQAKAFVRTAQSADNGPVQVEIAGQVARIANQAQTGGVVFGAIAALIVLLFVFGSALAATTPLITAGAALVAATALASLLSHVLHIASWSSQLSLLIGLGVGVDYALFIVTRMRQGLQNGKSVTDSIVDALDTSGRAVMFAGITVCIALLGMFALGVSFLYGVAVAASITVALTVVSALTLLPALLGFIGPRVLSRRQRRALAAGRVSSKEGTGWRRWSERLQARPATFAALATLLMLAIAIPFLTMRLGSADAGSDPASTTTRKAYDLLAKGFGPGYNGPLELVAQLNGRPQRQAFDRAAAAVAKTSGVAHAAPPVVLPAPNGHGVVAVAQVYPKGSPQDESTTELLHTLRNQIIPAASAGTGVHVLVGGQTAIFEDFSKVLSAKLPLFIGAVVILSFLLLMVVFRSLLIPAMAAVMNLLSVVAAFGVVTAVFQHGFGASLLGIDKAGPIEAFVPVMMFAILFGLSMDYEVFLVSRIYEEWHRSGDNRVAITRGLAATGRTITAAALIMVLVFAAFILGGERIIKLFGLGLASAVALDAIIVRSALVPSLMLLTGAANWKLPRFLERVLPRVNVEGSVEEGKLPAPKVGDPDAPPARA